MTYTIIYDKLIQKAKDRIVEGYTERHHIIPKCLGGSNDSTNLIRLTGREHYIAHLLLWKIHSHNYKLMHAFKMMCTCDNNGKRLLFKSSRFYEKARKEHSEHCKNRPLETRQKISKALKGRKQTKEFIEKRANKIRGLKRSEEQKQAMSQRMLKAIACGEFEPNIKGLRSHIKGEFVHSDASKRKMSKNRSGKSYEEIYGTEQAAFLRESKKQNTGNKNPNYRELDTTLVKSLLDEGKTIQEIKLIVKAPYITIVNKFKQRYEISITDYRTRINTRN